MCCLQTLTSVELTLSSVNQDSVRTPTAPTTVSVSKDIPLSRAALRAQVNVSSVVVLVMMMMMMMMMYCSPCVCLHVCVCVRVCQMWTSVPWEATRVISTLNVTTRSAASSASVRLDSQALDTDVSVSSVLSPLHLLLLMQSTVTISWIIMY